MTDRNLTPTEGFALFLRDAGMSEECPYCHETFFAPPGHDPLKKHFDYCPEKGNDE